MNHSLVCGTFHIINACCMSVIPVFASVNAHVPIGCVFLLQVFVQSLVCFLSAPSRSRTLCVSRSLSLSIYIYISVSLSLYCFNLFFLFISSLSLSLYLSFYLACSSLTLKQPLLPQADLLLAKKLSVAL